MLTAHSDSRTDPRSAPTPTATDRFSRLRGDDHETVNGLGRPVRISPAASGPSTPANGSTRPERSPSRIPSCGDDHPQPTTTITQNPPYHGWPGVAPRPPSVLSPGSRAQHPVIFPIDHQKTFCSRWSLGDEAAIASPAARHGTHVRNQTESCGVVTRATLLPSRRPVLRICPGSASRGASPSRRLARWASDLQAHAKRAPPQPVVPRCPLGGDPLRPLRVVLDPCSALSARKGAAEPPVGHREPAQLVAVVAAGSVACFAARSRLGGAAPPGGSASTCVALRRRNPLETEAGGAGASVPARQPVRGSRSAGLSPRSGATLHSAGWGSLRRRLRAADCASWPPSRVRPVVSSIDLARPVFPVAR